MALGALVRENAPLFAADGGAIACYRRFADVLMANNDLTRIEALRDRAEAERQTGLRFDRAAYTADLAETVQELSAALPALTKGDDGPFRQTKAYDSAQAYLALRGVRRTRQRGSLCSLRLTRPFSASWPSGSTRRREPERPGTVIDSTAPSRGEAIIHASSPAGQLRFSGSSYRAGR